MKKRVMVLVLTMLFSIVSMFSQNLSAFAKENEDVVGTEGNIDHSYFTPLNSLYGHANATRGVYLASGDSAITKHSSYEIGASGVTTAAVRCDVTVIVIVERYNMQTDGWQFITSWTKENTNAFTAAISKSLIVDSGYYYRVRSLHYAGTDSSSSWTNALYVN